MRPGERARDQLVRNSRTEFSEPWETPPCANVVVVVTDEMYETVYEAKGSVRCNPGARAYPTEPSSFRLMSWFTSAANSSGNSLNTSLQNPEMIIPTASSAPMPRCWK